MLSEPWRIELFGSLRAIQKQTELTRFRTQKTGALLAYLAYHLSRAHSREQLIDLFWPDHDPEAGRNSLSVALNSLRRQLEPPGTEAGAVLIADRAAVRLNPEACFTDVAEFARELDAAERAESDAERIRPLVAANALYNGGLLPGCYDAWIGPERERLADLRLGALRRLTRCLAQAREWDRAVEYARLAIVADPLREESHRSLMRLYAALGRPAAIKEAYQALEQTLKESLGASPSDATRALLAQLTSPLGSVSAPVSHAPTSSAPSASPQLPAAAALPRAEQSPPVSASPLPRPFTHFFGREEEIERLVALLHPDAAPDENSEARGDSPALLSAESSATPPKRQNAEAAREKPCLLSLTGPGGVGKTRLALAIAYRVRDLFSETVCFVPLAETTDPRRILDAIGEALSLPRSPHREVRDQVIEALQGRRALVALDNFEQLAEAGPPILHDLLERLPLLTFLVTSRQALEIEGEYEYPVRPLPIPAPSDTPERLLAYASIQIFVDRARAKRPDFQITDRNAAAIAMVCLRLEGIPLALELAAAWTSLLTPAQILIRLERRFELLVSRRKDLPARHVSLWATIEGSYRLLSPALQRFFARLAIFRGGWTLEAAERVCEETNVLEGLQALQQRSLLQAAEAVGSTMRYQMLETLREFAEEQLSPEERDAQGQRHTAYYLALAEQARSELTGADQASWLERLEADHDNLRAALERAIRLGEEEAFQLGGALVRFWDTRGYLHEGRRWLDAMLAALPAQAGEAHASALSGAGLLAIRQGDHAKARALLERSLEIYRPSGNRRGIATSLNTLGMAAREQGDYDGARRLYEESLDLLRQLQDDWAVAGVLNNLGGVAVMRGDYGAARTLYEQNLEISRKQENRAGIAFALGNLGLVAFEQGNLENARALQEESLAIRRALGSRQPISMSLSNLGNVILAQGDIPTARAIQEECLAIKREIGDRAGIATALNNMGMIAALRSENALADRLWRESLSIRQELHDRRGASETLAMMASDARAQRRYPQSVLLFSASESLRKQIHAPLSARLQAESDRAREEARASLGEERAQELWAQGQGWTWDQILAYAQTQLQIEPL